eukprot:6490995-Amphidinium_carterae.2
MLRTYLHKTNQTVCTFCFAYRLCLTLHLPLSRMIHLRPSAHTYVAAAPGATVKLAQHDIIVSAHAIVSRSDAQGVVVLSEPDQIDSGGNALLVASALPLCLCEPAMRAECRAWSSNDLIYTLPLGVDGISKATVQEAVTRLVHARAFAPHTGKLVVMTEHDNAGANAALLEALFTLQQLEHAECLSMTYYQSEWRFTVSGFAQVKLCLQLSRPVSPFHVDADKDPWTASRFELCVLLQQDGWEARNRRPRPYVGAAKQFFLGRAPPNIIYLQCLLHAPLCLPHANGGIMHGQAVKYYKRLLSAAGLIHGVQRLEQPGQEHLNLKSLHLFSQVSFLV